MVKILIDSNMKNLFNEKNYNYEFHFSTTSNILELLNKDCYSVFILDEKYREYLFNIRINPVNQNSYLMMFSEEIEFCPCSDILINEQPNSTNLNNLISSIESLTISLHKVTVFNLLKRVLIEKDPDLKTQLYKVPIITKFIIDCLIREKKYVEYLNDQFIDETIYFSAIHDLGKLAISNELLNFTGKFDDKQRKNMQLHSNLGEELYISLSNVFPEIRSVIGQNIIKYHHEKYDGSGYPSGLSQNNIPLEARIVAVADVYDALRSNRKYKIPFTHEKSFGILVNDSGSHFDPVIINTLIKYEKELDNIYSKLK